MNILKNNVVGAWMTDIDDTLVYSGEMPDENKINQLADFISALKKHHILWVPMSGVAMVKLGPRILFRLPSEVLDHVVYYGGDGSLKYAYDESSSSWKEDHSFSCLFSDAQTYMILGDTEYRSSISELDELNNVSDAALEQKIREIREFLEKKGFGSVPSILDLLKDELKKNGVDPDLSEAYFRGGSVSWMMLGDISADPYHSDVNIALRKKLIDISKKWLAEHNHLADLGSTGINVPFPGARGIKFVLIGNDKERSAREMISCFGLEPQHVIFAGNELFDGGNDNMIRNIEDVHLLSVGDREDPGPAVINGRIKQGLKLIAGVEANKHWMDYVVGKLQSGEGWKSILKGIRDVAL